MGYIIIIIIIITIIIIIIIIIIRIIIIIIIIRIPIPLGEWNLARPATVSYQPLQLLDNAPHQHMLHPF